MKKLYKLLNKYNKEYLYKQKENKKTMKAYKKDFERQGLDFKIKNDFDYLAFSILKTSFDNMTSIQKAFFEIKESLRELWPVITYQEKHFLLYQELNPVMDSLKSFEIDDKRYFMTYFDDLMNAYYDHDMLMFENASYQKYLYDYKNIINLEMDYNIIPIENGFADVDYFFGSKDHYILYNQSVKRFYIYKGSEQDTVGFVQVLSDKQIETIAQLLHAEDKAGLLEYLIEEDLATKRLKKKLIKKQRKMLK